PHATRVALHQRRDGVQRVEQEVRIELHAERVETRFGELRAELARDANRLFPLRAKTQRERAREAGGEHAHIHDEMIEEPGPKPRKARRHAWSSSAPSHSRRKQ